MMEATTLGKLQGRQLDIIKAIFDKSETEALECLYLMVDDYYEKLRAKEKRNHRMLKRINVLQGQRSLRPLSYDLDELSEFGYLGKLSWSDTITLENLPITQLCRDYFKNETE